MTSFVYPRFARRTATGTLLEAAPRTFFSAIIDAETQMFIVWLNGPVAPPPAGGTVSRRGPMATAMTRTGVP